MQYENARPLVRAGDLIALSHTGWSSWQDLEVQTVRLVTESEYSHVGLVWEVAGRLFVIEAVEPLVRLVPLSNFAAKGFYWIPLGRPITDDELRYALAKVGVARYSKWQAILGYLRRLAIGADDLEQCSEFVIACRRLSGVDLGDAATPSAVVLQAQRQGAALYYIAG